MKKHFTALLVLVLVLGLFQVSIRPKAAEAGFPTVDVGNLPAIVGNFVNTTVSKINEAQDWLKEFGLDKVAVFIAQKSSQKLITTVNNKLSGNGGEDRQSLVQDFDQYFRDQAFQEFQRQTDDLMVSNNPLIQQATRNVVKNAGGALIAENKNPLALSSIFGVQTGNTQAFNTKLTEFQNDPTIYGWTGLFALGLPQNSPIGAQMVVDQQLASNITVPDPAQRRAIELTSTGLRPAQTCSPRLNSSYNSGQIADYQQNAELTNGDTNYQSQIDELQARIVNIDAALAGMTDPEDPDYMELELEKMDLQSQITQLQNLLNEGNQSSSFWTGQANNLANEQLQNPNLELPLDCLITNPIGSVSKSLDLLLEEPFKRLQNADELGEVVMSTLLQISKNVINHGLNKLGTLSFSSNQKQYGSPSDFTNATNGTQTTNAPAQVVDFANELAPAIEATRAEINAYQQSIQLLRDNTKTAADLDVCTPGPDSGWEARLQKYYSRRTQAITALAAKEAKTEEQQILAWVEQTFERSTPEWDEYLQNPLWLAPGAQEGMQLVDQHKQRLQKISQTLSIMADKQRALSVAESIIAEARSIDGSLVLTQTDWKSLDGVTKTARVASATAILPAPVFIPDNPATATNENDDAKGDYVVEASWKKFEQQMTSPDQQDKLQTLYRQFSEVRENLTTGDGNALAELGSAQDHVRNLQNSLEMCMLSRYIFTMLPFNQADFVQVPQTYIGNPDARLYNTDGSMNKIRVYNMQNAKDLAFAFLANYYDRDNPAEVLSRKTQLAQEFPDFSARLKKILLPSNFLDKPSNYMGDLGFNSLNESLQVGMPGSLSDIYQKDTTQGLYCRLPGSLMNTMGIEKATEKAYGLDPGDLTIAGGPNRAQTKIQTVGGGAVTPSNTPEAFSTDRDTLEAFNRDTRYPVFVNVNANNSIDGGDYGPYNNEFVTCAPIRLMARYWIKRFGGDYPSILNELLTQGIDEYRRRGLRWGDSWYRAVGVEGFFSGFGA